METTAKNKIISKFMGLTIITDGISYFDTNYKPLKKYHLDWNDLMQVIEKIEVLEHKITITTNIMGVYDEVFKFIEQYNTLYS